MLRITDQNWQYYKEKHANSGVLPRYLRYGSREAVANKMIPFQDTPIKLIPRDEWKERIAEANEKRTMPYHWFLDNKVPAKSQNGFNYCWAYGCAAAIEHRQMLQGKPYCRLGANGLGRIVRWKNVGNYLSDAIRGSREFGIPSAEFVDDSSIKPRTFKDGWEEDALNHRSDEWIDTDYRSEDEMVDQCVSLYLQSFGTYNAFNWWSHALFGIGVKWDERERYNLVWLQWNSYNDGLIEMTGRRAVPDESYALGSATFYGKPSVANEIIGSAA